MPGPELPIEGHCRCGKIRFRISAPPLMTLACHCTGCQRMTASAYSLGAAIPTQGFEVIAGEPVPGGLHRAEARHMHCDWCKGWVYTEFAADMGFVNVRATLLEDTSWFAPFVESYTSEALPWAATSAKHRFETFPAMEDFPALIAEYAAQ